MVRDDQKKQIKRKENPALVDLGSTNDRKAAGKAVTCNITSVLLGPGHTKGNTTENVRAFAPGVMTREFISVAAGRHKSTTYYEGEEARNMAHAIYQCVDNTNNNGCAHAIDWDIWDDQHHEWVGSVKNFYSVA